jgi:multisubunit Na+/H+ antiporter MnhG subunit
VFKNSQFGLASPARTKSLHAFLFVLLMLLTFTMLVNPVVSHFLNTVEQNINTFLKQNFQSYIDYAMASPIFYYLILNFIGLTKVN